MIFPILKCFAFLLDCRKREKVKTTEQSKKELGIAKSVMEVEVEVKAR